MNAAERLYEQYQRDLKHLQETCPHAELTDWNEEWWAPGHSTGREVKACANCNKIVQVRRQCHVCTQWFAEEHLKQGDGARLAFGGWYCASCYAQVNRAGTETTRAADE
jgi:RNA polymerase subunit RPABC4/transcription elongation factor Spt4